MKSGDWNFRQSRQQRDWSTVEDDAEVRVDPIPIPLLPFEGARIQRERITKQDNDEFGATIGCPGCNCNQRQHKITGTLTAERESKNASELFRMEQKGWVGEMR